MYQRILIIYFCLQSVWSIAQTDSLNSGIVLQKSYDLYMTQEWDSLQTLGKTALKQDFDSYYLRMRLGISYYEQKKYRLAEEHFIQAIEFNDFVDLPKEYLYFCLLYTEQYDRARKLSENFSEELTLKTEKYQSKKLSLIYAEHGRKKPSLDSLLGSMGYTQIGLSHHLGKSSSLNHGYTHLKQQNTYSDFTQHQYFINANLEVGNKWTISPTFHVIDVKSNWEEFNSETGLIESKQLGRSYAAASLLFTYKTKLMNLSQGIGFSNLDDKFNLQPNLFVSFYPFANHKFSIYANPSPVFNTEKGWEMTSKYGLNYRPNRFIRFSAEYYHGNTNNLLENNGTLINNTLNITNSRINLYTEITVRKKLGLYFLYQIENKTEAYYQLDFHYNTPVFGIKFAL